MPLEVIEEHGNFCRLWPLESQGGILGSALVCVAFGKQLLQQFFLIRCKFEELTWFVDFLAALVLLAHSVSITLCFVPRPCCS